MKTFDEVKTEAQEYIKTVYPTHATMHPQQWKDLTDCYLMAYLSGVQDAGPVDFKKYLEFRKCLKEHAGKRMTDFVDDQG